MEDAPESDLVDPYTIRPGDARAAPTTAIGRLKYLGPSVIVSGSIVGSGEIILTSSLGAAVGFSLLWWVLLGCWSKSIVQAELGRYVVATGDTYLRALARLPGRIPGPRGPVAWPIWLGLLGFIPGVAGLGGIMGGAGQALTLLVPQISDTVGALVVCGVVTLLLAGGAYRRLENVMLTLVIAFTATTLVCAIAMQFTEFRLDTADLIAGLSFDFPIEYIVLAMAAYGYTGVNTGEVAAYTYWCVEKGYPSYIGAERDDAAWVGRARGWIRVLQMDVWVTLLILTCATLPFYFLGAGVLNPLGERPEGQATIASLSNMFTATLGPWAFWLFAIGAFSILFSSVVSAIGAGGRVVPDYLTVLGFLDRGRLADRYRWTRGYIIVVPFLGFLLYLGFQSPVVLVSIGALASAALAPIQSGATLWLQRRHMDSRVAPGVAARSLLAITFVFQVAMACLIIRFVIF
ncbi:MAG: Nramp family divalent metal transporter [Gammaproteobacteria bacterium]|nr:Nramp family divalent metal transporter [Gammaproteobacteria bacterium]